MATIIEYFSPPVLLPVLLPVVLPLAGASLALVGSIWHLKRVSWIGAAAGVAAGTVALAALASGALQSGALPIHSTVGGWPASAGIEVTLDAAGMVLGPILFVIAFLILVYAIGEGTYGPVFAAVYAIAVAGMGGVILAGDLFNLFVFFEILSLCAVILIAYKRQGPALYAALRYLMVASVSIAFYLAGLLFLYRVTGELSLAGTIRALQADSVVSSPETVRIAALGIGFIMGAIATRVAIVPFHGWLPAAHGQAPTPVSAFLSGLMLKSGFLALLRTSAIARIVAPGLFETLLILGALSAVAGAFMAFAQSDVKRLLAFSSISQMGYIVAGLAAGAFGGAVYHAAGHALFKSLLFLVVGFAVARGGSHHLEVLRERSSHGTRRRGALIEVAVFFLAAAAVAGVPGLSGYAGKELIGAGLRDGGGYALRHGVIAYQLLGIASMGTVATFLKLGLLYVPRRGGQGAGNHETRRGSAVQVVVVIILGGLLVAHGAFHRDLVTIASVRGFLPTMAAGSVLFALSRVPANGRGLARLARWRFGIDGVLALVFAGMLLLTR